jgi:predicted DCC family thiol-disulfide oxidoreductase YuxK
MSVTIKPLAGSRCGRQKTRLSSVTKIHHAPDAVSAQYRSEFRCCKGYFRRLASSECDWELMEMPEPRDQPPVRGWILYDANCSHCISAAKKFERIFGSRGFQILPLQTPWIEKRLGLGPGELLEEMRVLTATGEDFGGADAIVFLARQLWWTRPFYMMAKLPGGRGMLDRLYRRVAANRGCIHAGADQPAAKG